MATSKKKVVSRNTSKRKAPTKVVRKARRSAVKERKSLMDMVITGVEKHDAGMALRLFVFGRTPIRYGVSERHLHPEVIKHRALEASLDKEGN